MGARAGGRSGSSIDYASPAASATTPRGERYKSGPIRAHTRQHPYRLARLARKLGRMTNLVRLCALSSFLLLAACEPDAPAAPPTPPALAAEADARAAERAAFDAAFAGAKAAARASRGAGRPALWTLKDSDTTIHLLGTVHLLRPDLAWRSPEIDRALNAATTLVFEIDTTSPQSQRDLMAFVSEAGLAKDGRQLTSLMNQGEAADFAAAAAGVDMPVEAMQVMKPWYAAMTLSALYMQKDGYDPKAGVEAVLEQSARAGGKQLAYLETPQQQLGHFAELPEEIQMDFLVSSLDRLDESGSDLDVIVAEWADGDTQGMARLLSDAEMWGSPALYDALLVKRNEAWVPKIKAMLDAPGTVLVAVGAAHLTGDDSVIASLREDGLTVSGP